MRVELDVGSLWLLSFSQNHELLVCHVCKGPLRQVEADNTLLYKNGDRTSTPVTAPSKCGCGFKHFWDGKEYDNLPER